MSPADVAALLKIKQARERRVRSALEAARSVEREATRERLRVEGMQDAFIASARESRQQAFERVEAVGEIGSWTLQAINADLAGLAQQGAALSDIVRRAEAAEAEVHADTAAAEQRHRAAQRAAEAFDYLSAKVVAESEAKALDAEEAETEEPRARLLLGRG